ncbi:MAG: hypothetical protein IPP66_16745 [Anaerolineales bacterium]|nr:hypothetical protein [Anaerolineales bacterium]
MPRKIFEDQTRKQIIDPQLEQAGWCLHSFSRKEIMGCTINTHRNYNADQIRFLRAVQSVFLQKRHLETADLYDAPLDMFGADAVERWFTEKEEEEVVEFANRMAV